MKRKILIEIDCNNKTCGKCVFWCGFCNLFDPEAKEADKERDRIEVCFEAERRANL